MQEDAQKQKIKKGKFFEKSKLKYYQKQNI